MHRQLQLFDQTHSARDWDDLPANTRIEVLRRLARAAARMLRNPEEIDHDGYDFDNEGQEPSP